MYMTCRHIKSNGLSCKSPALKGGHFCYYHSKIHTVGADTKFGPLLLPAPEDPAAIQLSVARINDAVLHGRLDLRKALTLLNGLKLAARFIDSRVSFDEAKTVQSANQTAAGDELAPDRYICNDDDDCDECPYSERCSHRGHPGCEDDEEQEDNDEEDGEEEDEEEDDDEEDE